MRRWAGIGVVFVLGLAACSGNGSSTTATTAPAITATGVTTTTTPKFSGSATSNYCNVARQVSQISVQNLSTDPRTIVAQVDAIAGPYLAAAPPAIHDDVVLFIGAIQQLEAAIKAANYDLTKVPASAYTPLQDPKIAAAVARINAYNGQVCQLVAATTTTTTKK
jgi:hypothetical protein